MKSARTTTLLSRSTPVLASVLFLVASFLACSGTTATVPPATNCPGAKTLCNGSCTLLASDGENCGQCGVKCAADEVCLQGSCGTSCGPGSTSCTQSGGARYCANLQTDQSNCGKCGTKCGPTTVCKAGKCAPTCSAEQTLCMAGATYCANLQTDDANCGACGITCMPYQTCSSGVCTSQCDYQQKTCVQGNVTRCVNYLSDNKNCGACDAACPPNVPVCEAGKCTTGIYPPTCVKANGLLWCYNPAACGEGCAAVCSALGMTVLQDMNVWLNGQNTLAKCSAISQAFGLGPALGIGPATYGCVEDWEGDHTNVGLKAPFICSTWAPCPADHVTKVDGLGLPCNAAQARRAVCPCQ